MLYNYDKSDPNCTNSSFLVFIFRPFDLTWHPILIEPTTMISTNSWRTSFYIERSFEINAWLHTPSPSSPSPPLRFARFLCVPYYSHQWFLFRSHQLYQVCQVLFSDLFENNRSLCLGCLHACSDISLFAARIWFSRSLFGFDSITILLQTWKIEIFKMGEYAKQHKNALTYWGQ